LKDVGANLKEISSTIDDIFNNPIKGFGVLGEYARRRAAEATGFGTAKILRELHPDLRVAAATYEQFVVELSKSSDALLREHGKQIADFQYQQKRVADCHRHVRWLVHIRADSWSGKNAAESAVTICEIFTHQARRMSRNVIDA
jgi:hypothetical protein